MRVTNSVLMLEMEVVVEVMFCCERKSQVASRA